MSEPQYWFGFRQTTPKPAGKAVACGPFRSWDEASRERDKANAPDCVVSFVFTAKSKEEAEEKAEKVTGLP